MDRFLICVDAGRIDHNMRDRDFIIKKNRDSAIASLRILTGKLENMDEQKINKSLVLHLESGNFISEEHAWCETSVLRELEFVQSHALHHFALFAAKLEVYRILEVS